MGDRVLHLQLDDDIVVEEEDRNVGKVLSGTRQVGVNLDAVTFLPIGSVRSGNCAFRCKYSIEYIEYYVQVHVDI